MEQKCPWKLKDAFEIAGKRGRKKNIAAKLEFRFFARQHVICLFVVYSHMSDPAVSCGPLSANCGGAAPFLLHGGAKNAPSFRSGKHATAWSCRRAGIQQRDMQSPQNEATDPAEEDWLVWTSSAYKWFCKLYKNNIIYIIFLLPVSVCIPSLHSLLALSLSLLIPNPL